MVGPHTPYVFGRCLLGFRPRTVNGDAMNGSNHSMATCAVMATAVCTVAAHMALLFWWSRRKHEDAQPRHSEEEWTEPPPAYAVLGESVPPDRVLAMQSEAGDVDQTALASEDRSLATKPSTTLHPFHALLTQPVKGSRPGILPYSKKKTDVLDPSPTAITVPLFVSRQPAEHWRAEDRTQGETVSDDEHPLARSFDSDADSLNSSLVRATPSLVGSSIVLTVEEAQATRSEPTWAPPPPRAKTHSNVIPPFCPFRRLGGQPRL